MIDSVLREFSLVNNQDIDCCFNKESTAACWSVSYGEKIEDPIYQIVAMILLSEYVPYATPLYVYIGYGQGDDNLYPIL